MISVIDTFATSNGDQYGIRYNDFTGAITTVFLHVGPGGGAEVASVTPEERGHDEGDPLPGVICTTDGTFTRITFNASLNNPFATIAAIEPGMAECGAPDPVDPCDLTITSVTTVNESAPGAHDGSITIHATSTGGTINYSINGGATLSLSATFTGLAGGSGTAYVRDDAGCTATQAYTIITAPVDRLVSTPATDQSRWSALFNPIVFGYQSATHAPGRKFITKITSGYDGAANVITATHAANLTGYCRADISKYLRTLLQPKDEIGYTAINYRDANISASYTVEYKEVWDGGADAAWTSAGDPFYVTYSAMQIGNPTGGNMQPYLTLPGAGQTHPAKFLNDFKNPVFYTDMPWEIRGISLRILYLLISFSVVSTAGIMTSYFSLKNDNQLLSTQIEILKIQYKIIDQRLEKMESKKDVDIQKQHFIPNVASNTSIPSYNFLAAITGRPSKNN